ncbi:MAG: radical SAM/SPASM domain-containing protein [Candidatus Caldatribacteriaceae bacterium]
MLDTTCIGCYSRDRSTEDELSSKELDNLFKEAEELGIPSVVVTGGEPFSREDLLPLMEKHKFLLFVVITNGVFLSSTLAKNISRSGNVVTIVSVEGFEMDTDGRRQVGAYRNAVRAMEFMRLADGIYGFAATNTCKNHKTLSSGRFINEMISLGCAFRFFTEYVPCGDNPRDDWVMDEEQREEFRETVIGFRKTKPILIVQFPHDEYGKDNICSAAGRASFHVNSQGGVEPCPFSPYSCDNVRDRGLRSACESRFLKSIRKHQELLRRKGYACALFEHREEISELRDRCCVLN